MAWALVGVALIIITGSPVPEPQKGLVVWSGSVSGPLLPFLLSLKWIAMAIAARSCPDSSSGMVGLLEPSVSSDIATKASAKPEGKQGCLSNGIQTTVQ